MSEEQHVRYTRPTARLLWQNAHMYEEAPELLRSELERFDRLHGDKLRKQALEPILSALEEHVRRANSVRSFADAVNWSVDLLAHMLALYAHRGKTRIPPTLLKELLDAADRVSDRIPSGPERMKVLALPTVLKFIFEHINRGRV